jgi:hypothetical protein
MQVVLLSSTIYSSVAITHPKLIENTAESSYRETNNYYHIFSEKLCLVKWQTNPNTIEKLTV